MSEDYVEHAGCRVMNQPTEQNIVALSLITQAHSTETRLLCVFVAVLPQMAHYMEKPCPLSQIDFFGKFNYALKWTASACGWKKKKKRFWIECHPLKRECVTFPWILNWECYSVQVVPVIVNRYNANFIFYNLFFFFFTQSPINVFAQSECAQTLTSVCQKWCQCSHGNYSYTLPPCSSTVRVALSAICLSNVRSHLSAGRCRCRGWRVAYGPQRRMWWWGEREGAELFGLICRFVLSS